MVVYFIAIPNEHREEEDGATNTPKMVERNGYINMIKADVIRYTLCYGNPLQNVLLFMDNSVKLNYRV